MEIPIKILASDIIKGGYTDSYNCAITKAVERANIAGYHSGFSSICEKKNNTQIAEIKWNKEDQFINPAINIISSMYYGGIEKRDVEATLIISEENYNKYKI